MAEWVARMGRSMPAAITALAIYFTVNIVVRLVLPHSLELDEGQQLFYAQWLELGYDSQPPFYNWLQYGSVLLFGNSILALTLLKNLMLFCTYLLYGQAAGLLLSNRGLAVVAMLGLITIPQIGFEAERDLSHTVGVLFAACLFAYALFATLKAPTLFHYGLTGLSIGIGMLAKYNFVLLPFAALIALLADRDLRPYVLDRRLLLTAVIPVLVFAPHGFWILTHLELATARTIGKLTTNADAGQLMRIGRGLSSLVQAMIGFSAPTLLIFAAIFRRDLPAIWRAESQWTRLIGRIFVILSVTLTVLVVFGGASLIKDRWLVPMFFLLPLYLALKIEAAGIQFDASLRRFLVVIAIVMVLIPTVLLVRLPLHAALGRYEKLNVPYRPAIEAIVATNPEPPALIVAGDQQLAGNIRLNLPDTAVTIPGFETLEPKISLRPDQSILLIWRNKGKPDATLPAALADWLGHHADLDALAMRPNDLARPYFFARNGDLYHFYYAWIGPRRN